MFNETFKNDHDSTDHIYKVSRQYGLVHFLKPSPGAIGFLPEESLTIELNGHLCYFVIFYDPTFQILSENPTAVPKILLKIDEDKHGLHKIYLKVSPFHRYCFVIVTVLMWMSLSRIMCMHHSIDVKIVELYYLEI